MENVNPAYGPKPISAFTIEKQTIDTELTGFQKLLCRLAGVEPKVYYWFTISFKVDKFDFWGLDRIALPTGERYIITARKANKFWAKSLHVADVRPMPCDNVLLISRIATEDSPMAAGL